jgi:hypothetical protein
MQPGIFIGGLLIASGIYGWTHGFFHPEKISRRISLRVYKLLCLIMIICGLIVIVL